MIENFDDISFPVAKLAVVNIIFAALGVFKHVQPCFVWPARQW